VSDAGLVGGSNPPRPGEGSLAHNGILFLDELTEFRRNVLETLRQPLEEGCIVIARANAVGRYPARFQLLAAMNPCPCGGGRKPGACSCTPREIARYRSKLSGPLLDRISIHIGVGPADPGRIAEGERGATSEQLRQGVLRARRIQHRRYRDGGVYRCNADVPLHALERFCPMEKDALRVLEQAQRALRFSARTRRSIVQVSRTIADLARSPVIGAAHVAEAVQYRVPAVFGG